MSVLWVVCVGVTTTIPNSYKSTIFGILVQPELSLCHELGAMRTYLNLGGNPNRIIAYHRTFDTKQSLLQCASSDVAELLLAHKDLNLNYELQQAIEPFRNHPESQKAVYPSSKYLVERLLELGAAVNAKDNNGATPLHTVRTPEIAQLLIAKGADVNAKDQDGRTPLHTAAADAATKNVVKLLVAKEADVNVRDRNSVTPLAIALATVHNSEAVKVLIAHGADLDAKDKAGNTLLHKAYRPDEI